MDLIAWLNLDNKLRQIIMLELLLSYELKYIEGKNIIVYKYLNFRAFIEYDNGSSDGKFNILLYKLDHY